MRRLRCRKCRSVDLVLHETRLEHAEYDGGLYVNEQGCIEARGIGYFEPGEIQPRLTRINCAACGHELAPAALSPGVP